MVARPQQRVIPAQTRTVTPPPETRTAESTPIYDTTEPPRFADSGSMQPTGYTPGEDYQYQPPDYTEQTSPAQSYYESSADTGDQGPSTSYTAYPMSAAEQARTDTENARVDIERMRAQTEKESAASAAAARERPYQSMTKAEQAQTDLARQAEQDKYTKISPYESGQLSLRNLEIRRPSPVTLEHGAVGLVDPTGSFNLLRDAQPYEAAGNLIQPSAFPGPRAGQGWTNGGGGWGGPSGMGWPQMAQMQGYGGGQGWQPPQQSGFGGYGGGTGYGGGWQPQQQMQGWGGGGY